jgi:cobalt-zinc-cadmium resistance protein CzcA
VLVKAVQEVATPVILGVGIIILVFLPLMTLQGMEGKMFAPLASPSRSRWRSRCSCR